MGTEKQIFDTFKKTADLKYGAKFFKADLHFHTPASEDARGSNRYNFNPYKIKYPSDASSPNYPQAVKQIQDKILTDARKIASAIVQQFRKEYLSLVAVTDHNGLGTIWSDNEFQGSIMDLAAPTWYELIDDEAQKINRAEGKTVLTILPGTEISTSGVHILAIFPPQNPRRKIHFMICDLLHEAGFAIEDWSKNPKVGKLSPFRTIDLIVAKGGVPILAHIDGSDQALLNLYKINSGAMKDVLCHKDLSAVEIVKPSRFTKRDPQVKKPLKDWIADQRLGQNLEPLAYFQGSDAHQIPDIAKRHTFIKMSAPFFSGFNTAIQMPSSRIRISDMFTPSKSGFYIHSMEITDPFFGNQKFRFNRHLNCITGKKMTGKTSLFKLMQAAVHKDNPCAQSKITLFIEKITNGQSGFYAFNRNGQSSDIRLFSLNQDTSAAKEINMEEADQLHIKPGFYDAERIEQIIDTKTELNGFLTKHFGQPTVSSIQKLNKLFVIPRFLKLNPEPLLILEATQGMYKLLVNTRWHESKIKMVDFFKLNKSMRRTVLMCFIIILSDFGPTIIDAPETHFDNEDIANVLVPIIKQYKDEQQIILFTNNSLMAVNTDPDNYILLEANATGFTNLTSGFAIDDTTQKSLILNIMEGNLSSYLKRGTRYKSGS